MARFAETGLIQETISFGMAREAQLTYILAQDGDRNFLEVEGTAGMVKVLVPPEMSRVWAQTEQVGIAGSVDLGVRGQLSVLIEKDFACIDRSPEENFDTFPNPHAC